MIAKFTRGTDNRLGIRFEPEDFNEQLLLEQFSFGATSSEWRFRFSGWEHNHQRNANVRDGLTSCWGEVVKTAREEAVKTAREETAAKADEVLPGLGKLVRDGVLDPDDKPFVDGGTIDRVLFAVFMALDSSDAWLAARKEPRVFREAVRAALTPSQIDNTNMHLAALVRYWFEVYDRPCDADGKWQHSAEYRRVDENLRSAVGAQPAPKQR